MELATTQVDDLHAAVLRAYYTLKKGGAVVSCGDKYMLAVEFDGPTSSGGFCGEMTYVDKDKHAQAVVRCRQCEQARELGSNFLAGETIEYFEISQESIFFALLHKYKSSARTDGLIDIKSGLRLFTIRI